MAFQSLLPRLFGAPTEPHSKYFHLNQDGGLRACTAKSNHAERDARGSKRYRLSATLLCVLRAPIYKRVPMTTL